MIDVDLQLVDALIRRCLLSSVLAVVELGAVIPQYGEDVDENSHNDDLNNDS